MFEIRIHSRAGQGLVTAAELLSAAAFAQGRYAQVSPSFGSNGLGLQLSRAADSTTSRSGYASRLCIRT